MPTHLAMGSDYTRLHSCAVMLTAKKEFEILKGLSELRNLKLKAQNDETFKSIFDNQFQKFVFQILTKMGAPYINLYDEQIKTLLVLADSPTQYDLNFSSTVDSDDLKAARESLGEFLWKLGHAPSIQYQILNRTDFLNDSSQESVVIRIFIPEHLEKLRIGGIPIPSKPRTQIRLVWYLITIADKTSRSTDEFWRLLIDEYGVGYVDIPIEHSKMRPITFRVIDPQRGFFHLIKIRTQEQ